MNRMLELDDVHTYYGHIHALKGITVAVNEGEIVTLIGSNGAGKSTTLKTISGLLTPRTGQVRLQGQVISGLPAHKVAELGVAQSPEGRRIFPRMSVLENLHMGAFVHGSPKDEDLTRVWSIQAKTPAPSRPPDPSRAHPSRSRRHHRASRRSP